MTFDGISRQDMDFKPCTYLPLPPSEMTSLVHYSRRIDPMVCFSSWISDEVNPQCEYFKYLTIVKYRDENYKLIIQILKRLHSLYINSAKMSEICSIAN